MHRPSIPVAIAALAATALAGCATQPSATEEAPAGAAVGATVTVSYDGGVLVLDAASLEPLETVQLEGFLRLSDAGDDRHVIVSTADGFVPLDTGAGSSDAPSTGPLLLEAAEPGHVVPHAGTTLLWDDATGTIGAYATDALADEPAVETTTAATAHHGVAVALEDDTMLVTIGTSESRSGVAHIDADGTELAASDECPGVHGEGTLGDAILFGCEDGVLVFVDGAFTKIDAPDAVGRTGNLYLSEASTIAVGDYNADLDAEGYELTSLALVDTETDALEVLELQDGLAYTWRGVDRTDDGDIVLLGTDGALHLLDESGTELESIDVIDAWDGPIEWQDAHPNLEVHDGVAYVTEPASDAIHAVDLATGDITSGELAETPIELSVVG